MKQTAGVLNFVRRGDRRKIHPSMNNISNLEKIQRSRDEKPIQKTYFHKFHKILPALKFAECKIWIRGGWRSLHIIETFCKNNWATLEVEVVYYYTCMGGSVINTAMDINLPWNEASDRLMHIGLWIRIVRQLYESTVPPNKPKQTFLLHWKISKITHYNICVPPEKSVHFMQLDWKQFENEIMANIPI